MKKNMTIVDFKLADIKLESFEVYLPWLRLGKICRRISKLFTLFVKMRFQIYADIQYDFIPTRNT